MTELSETKGRTLLLTRESIMKTMRIEYYIEAVETAIKQFAEGTIIVPEVVHIPAQQGAFHIKSAAYIAEPFYVAVKVNGNFPENPKTTGLPTIQGVITLCDGRNGIPLAILDSTEITAQRTAAATAVAAKYLANPNSKVATIIGCGIQGRINLQALLHVLPLEQVFIFDIDTATCRSFAEDMRKLITIPITPVQEIAEGTLLSQVVVTCTSSRSAFLEQQHINPGTFIAAVGADNDDKQELYPDVLKNCKVVVDILQQCAEIGELHHALKNGVMTKTQVYADIGEIVTNRKSCCATRSDSVVFDSTGSAFQDVATAGIIYERARRNGLGEPLDLA